MFFDKPKPKNWVSETLSSIDTSTLATAGLALGATAAVGAGVYWVATRKAPRASFEMHRELNVPAERVLSFFADPERLTAAMEHADVDDERELVWKQEGPFGFVYTWSPSVKVDEELRELQWSTDDDAIIDAAGRVSVRPLRHGRSRLVFETEFQVPGPVWPEALHERTRRLVAEDLERVCLALEAYERNATRDSSSPERELAEAQ